MENEVNPRKMKSSPLDEDIVGVNLTRQTVKPRRRFRRARRRHQRWTRKSITAVTATTVLLLILCCQCDITLQSVAVAALDPADNSTNYDFEEEMKGELNEQTKVVDGDSSIPLQKKKVEESPHPERTMEEELQLYAEHQHNSKERISKEQAINAMERQEYQQFMDWCKQVMGIQTSLEIHTFYYYDFMTAIMTHPDSQEVDSDDDDDFEMDNPTPNASSTNTTNEEEWQDPPLIPVRGLRATRNISKGEVIISIPFQALLTVSTTIDQDPVLSRVMGPEARQAFGWTLGQDDETLHPGNMDSVDFFELPLLAMALLHHYKLGSSSPMYPYIHLLRKAPLDSMPFLWNKETRHKNYGSPHPTSTVAKGIQTVARSIRLEMKDMYHTVVDTLVQNHPDVFGRRNDNSSNGQEQYDILDDEDWAFSFENFQWAFAMVNSRHWLLPIVDLDTNRPPSESPPAATPMAMQPQGMVDGVPPAEMPTDAWVGQPSDEQPDDTTDGPQQQKRQNTEPKSPSYHSFLAPVADLLNFGPPCTRGRYNEDTHTFDIIASCNFTPGQEVTFWYSDECEEIVIGNYGFTHPMVPKCQSAEDHKLAKDKWKQRAIALQEALEDAYEDMDVMDTELQHVQQILANCDCCDTGRAATIAAYRQQQQKQTEQRQPGRQPQGNVDGLHGNYLRNPHDPAPSQIRGGKGTMNTPRGRSNRGGSGNESRNNDDPRNHRSREDQRSRSRPRGNRAATDDDVERHGVRRMWAGRSGL